MFFYFPFRPTFLQPSFRFAKLLLLSVLILGTLASTGMAEVAGKSDYKRVRVKVRVGVDVDVLVKAFKKMDTKVGVDVDVDVDVELGKKDAVAETKPKSEKKPKAETGTTVKPKKKSGSSERTPDTSSWERFYESLLERLIEG